MSRSTFNGPVLVGEDDAEAYIQGTLTTGPNWGFANMSQSAAFSEVDNATRFSGIIIPYKSVITKIGLLVTTVFSGGSGGYSPFLSIGVGWGPVPLVGYTPSGGLYDHNELAHGIDLSALGNIDCEYGAGLETALTGVTLNATINVTGIADTSGLKVGQMVRESDNGTDTDIQDSTFIASIVSSTAITLTKATITSGTKNIKALGIAANDIGSWMNVGSRAASGPSAADELIDRMIVYDTIGTSTGAGRAVLTINYCQAVDLSAIA